MADQKLTAAVEVTGAENASAQLGQVAAAQAKVSGQTQTAGDQAVQSAADQARLNASTETYLQLINQINPQLGQFVANLVRGSRVARDMAGSGQGLGNVLVFIKKGVLDNVKALGWLAAGAVAFSLISKGIEVVVEGLEREKKAREEVEEATRKQTEALNELLEKQAEQQVTLERISDLRAEGGFDADQAVLARQEAERLRTKFPNLDETSVNRAVGNLFGTGISPENMERAAFAIQQGRLEFDRGMPDKKRVERTLQALGIDAHHFAELVAKPEAVKPIDVARSRELQKSGDLAARITELGGSGADVNAALKLLPPDLLAGMEPDQIVEAVRRMRDVRREAQEEVRTAASPGELPPYAEIERGVLQRQMGLSTPQAEQLYGVALRILDSLERIAHGERSVTNNFQGATFNGADAAAREARSVYGAKLVDDRN
ncbi:MAG: hypothetical protein HY763_02180 [Planctomycetes bacterium]|nr:hypothetical protein [Planctomycetota bacterium]